MFWSLPALFFLYEFMLRVSPSVVESTLQTQFTATAAAFGFTMGMYYYAYAPMQLVVGLMLDRFGSRRPLAIAAIVCALGAALFAMASSLNMLGAGRLLAGAGSAFAYVGTIYVASVWFPSSRLALIAGVTAALGMAGAVAGETVLGWVDQFVDWRVSAWGFSVLAVGLGVGIWFLVPRRPAWFEHRVLMSRGEHGKSIFSGLRCVLSNRQTWLVAIITSLLYLPVGTFGALWGDSFMATCLNMGTAGAANADAMLFIGLGVSAPLMGWFADRTGHRRRVLVIGLCVALVGSVLLLFLTPAYADAMFPLLFMLGFGCGAIVIAFPMAIDLNPHFARGAAITFVNFFQMLLAGLGQWLIGVLLDGGETDKLAAVYSVGDFRKAFLMLPVGLVLALVLTVFLRNTKSDS
jgi:MFS family permease